MDAADGIPYGRAEVRTGEERERGVRGRAVTGPVRRRPGRPVAAAALVIGLAGVLAGCGGDGVTLPSERPSISLPSERPSVSLPTAVVPGEPTAPPTTVVPPEPTTEAPTPEPTVTPEPTETTAPTPEPTQTTAPATPTRTVERTRTVEPTQEPTTEPTPGSSPSGEAAPDADTQDGDEGPSPWWLVLLALLVLAAVTAAVLARSARRRREEEELLVRLRSRGRWAVDHGAGALIGAGDPASIQEAWSRLNATLVDLAGDVSTLAHRTPADQGTAVIALRDSVASLQGAAEAHARARLSGDPSPATAGAVFDARDRLSRALAVFDAPTSS